MYGLLGNAAIALCFRIGLWLWLFDRNVKFLHETGSV